MGRAAQAAQAATWLYLAERARHLRTVREDYPDHLEFGSGACLPALPENRARCVPRKAGE